MSKCSDTETARRCDEWAKKDARRNYGPLDEEPELDAYEMMMGKPEPIDFEPCEKPCRDSTCPCHYRDR